MQKHTIHNERIKLLANALDRASTASIAAGLIVSSVSALSHVEALSGLAIISSMVWLLPLLHYIWVQDTFSEG
ncbi:hypothetical protein FF124_09535 [Martelella lutilitoris]|uniref:Uncharacterized protein n=1 Tax=Martelella lutilitoris TaxID=2583532 RepID=A0A5C4JQZ6_9HYPH|nr:hypothetical protein [Martelella lutilitoris]TNB47826.1 hypothetical protein FF124_09535 [Martelella lutilitoris]